MSYKYDPILMMNVPIKTEDASLGSVEDYYNKMVGKSKSEVEKIVMKAKGNPNADLAYKKWKATHGVNDKDFVEDADECPEGMTCDANFDEFDKTVDKYLSSVKEKAAGSDPIKAYYAIRQVSGKFESEISKMKDSVVKEVNSKEVAARKRFFEIYNSLEKELGNKIRK